MRYIETIKEGDRINDIYFCRSKQVLTTKNGKPYESISLQDKTGMLDAKLWEPNGMGIDDYEAMDYIEVCGEVASFNGQLQLNVKRLRKCSPGEYDPKEYQPVSDNSIDSMWDEVLTQLAKVRNAYLKQLLQHFFNDPDFKERFINSSAAKSIHHGFIGGLLEHTLSVMKMCQFYCNQYDILNRDLLITAAACHDIGKTQELSPFPLNDYTDDGQLLGHIIIGSRMISDAVRDIDGFPHSLESELIHCILSHHGELEYGSPKKPAIAEAVALNLADLSDARLETLKECLSANRTTDLWLGYNRVFESNLRKTTVDE